MNEEAKKKVLQWFPYGLYAIGVHDGDESNAFTANWVTQTSFDPPMVAVAVENDGKSIGLMRDSKVFSVNVYDAGQRNAAGRLARPSVRAPLKLEEVAHTQGSTGVPLLNDSLGYVECRVTDQVETGDHTLFVGEVVEAGVFHEGNALTIQAAGFKYAG